VHLHLLVKAYNEAEARCKAAQEAEASVTVNAGDYANEDDLSNEQGSSILPEGNKTLSYVLKSPCSAMTTSDNIQDYWRSNPLYHLFDRNLCLFINTYWPDYNLGDGAIQVF
jgi:hypothetical protein